MFLFFSKMWNSGRLTFFLKQSWFNFVSEICEMDEGNQVPHMEQWNFLEYSIMGLGPR